MTAPDSLYHHNERYILDSIGLKIKMDCAPEFIAVRNKLYRMGPFRRWLSWKLRRHYGQLKVVEMQRILNDVIRCAS